MFCKNVNVITGELQHNIVMVVDVDRKQKWKTEWKLECQKRNAARLGGEPYRQLSKCRVKEVMSDSNNDLWGSLKGVLKTCDEVCGYKKSGNAT